MSDLLPAFIKSSRAAATASCSEDKAIALLYELEMGVDDWSDAGLPDLLRYVYGAKGLLIPRKWQPCFPASHFQHPTVLS